MSFATSSTLSAKKGEGKEIENVVNWMIKTYNWMLHNRCARGSPISAHILAYVQRSSVSFLQTFFPYIIYKFSLTDPVKSFTVFTHLTESWFVTQHSSDMDDYSLRVCKNSKWLIREQCISVSILNRRCFFCLFVSLGRQKKTETYFEAKKEIFHSNSHCVVNLLVITRWG